jgi:hypothetical protein
MNAETGFMRASAREDQFYGMRDHASQEGADIKNAL